MCTERACVSLREDALTVEQNTCDIDTLIMSNVWSLSPLSLGSTRCVTLLPDVSESYHEPLVSTVQTVCVFVQEQRVQSYCVCVLLSPELIVCACLSNFTCGVVGIHLFPYATELTFVAIAAFMTR